MQAFGISEDQINKATSILERSESTEIRNIRRPD